MCFYSLQISEEEYKRLWDHEFQEEFPPGQEPEIDTVQPAPMWPPEIQAQYDRFQWVFYLLRKAYMQPEPDSAAKHLIDAGDLDSASLKIRATTCVARGSPVLLANVSSFICTAWKECHTSALRQLLSAQQAFCRAMYLHFSDKPQPFEAPPGSTQPPILFLLCNPCTPCRKVLIISAYPAFLIC